MDDLKYMLKKVSTYNLYMLGILAIISSILNIRFVLPSILGLTVAMANFLLSTIVTTNAVIKSKVNFMTYFSFAFKIFTAGIIGVILFTHNKYYLVAYLCGYISHFIPLILYGLSLKDN